ncbi:MAG: riboflavin synthase [Legionellaceae bacterium]|jgi:riboflavin synthase|nr:riboflavin synthase [Legionellaceae bacterium]
MFTGLVEQCGKVRSQEEHVGGIRLVLEASFENLVLGESIAVNGVCLTLLQAPEGLLAFDVSPETLRATSLGSLGLGDGVHLERALRVSDRLGGHYVSGHVDMAAKISKITHQGEYTEVTIAGFDAKARRYLCPKGSVALDGVSLTINAVTDDAITVMLIPHTLSKTTLGTWVIGQRINVEFDYIARVLVHQLGSLTDSTIMTLFEKPEAGTEVPL